jgi:hypothetical protein
MAVDGYTFAVGTAPSIAVGMSADAQYVVLQNLEPASDVDELARFGYLYVVGQKFTLTGSGTALFNIATAPGGMQIEGYEIVTTEEPVFAELIEGATVTTTGAAIASYSLNRNEADDAVIVFSAASTVTGGSAVSSDFVSGSKQGGGGAMVVSKIHTLRGSQNYAMRFVNQANSTTEVLLQVIFAEKFNGQNDIWLGGEPGQAFRLRGGESVSLPMIAGQTLSVVSEQATTLGVLKQD